MHTGAGQNRTDRHLTVGHIQMELISPPEILMALAVGLDSDVALLRQPAHHLVQFFMPLLLDARAALTGLGFEKGAFGMFLLARLGLTLLFPGLFRETLACRKSPSNRGLYDRSAARPGAGDDGRVHLCGS